MLRVRAHIHTCAHTPTDTHMRRTSARTYTYTLKPTHTGDESGHPIAFSYEKVARHERSAHRHIYTHTCTHTHLPTYTYLHSHLHAYTHTRTHTHMHIDTQLYIQTYTNTHTLTNPYA